ncbi:hypothetical protein OROHE_013673 [Orobanche hederae]
MFPHGNKCFLQSQQNLVVLLVSAFLNVKVMRLHM